MDTGCARVLALCLVYTAHRVFTECPQGEIPVVDVCGTDPFTANVFYIHSVGMSDGFSQCSCTMSTLQDNNSVKIYPRADVTPSTCQAYILVVDGLPRGAAYAWCNRQGRFDAVMDTATPWSVDVVKTSSTAGASDPGHCLLVSGSGLLTVACRNDGNRKILKRPTTTPTTAAITPTRIVTPEVSIHTTVTGPDVRTGAPATQETATSPFTATPSPTAKSILVVTSSPSPDSPLAQRQTSSEMDTEEIIIIGVCVGVLLLIIIIIITVIVYRMSCRKERPVEKNTKHEIPVLHPMTEVVPDSNQNYSPNHPNSLYPGKVRRVNSSPPGVRPNMLVANDSYIHEQAMMEDGHLFRETSKEYRQHQLNVFKESKRNAERVNSGATIEAKRRYITRVAITGSGYNSQPNSRVNSFKRRPGHFLTTEEAFQRREGWYRAEPRYMLADSRSRSHSGHLGAL